MPIIYKLQFTGSIEKYTTMVKERDCYYNTVTGKIYYCGTMVSTLVL